MKKEYILCSISNKVTIETEQFFSAFTKKIFTLYDLIKFETDKKTKEKLQIYGEMSLYNKEIYLIKNKTGLANLINLLEIYGNPTLKAIKKDNIFPAIVVYDKELNDIVYLKEITIEEIKKLFYKVTVYRNLYVELLKTVSDEFKVLKISELDNKYPEQEISLKFSVNGFSCTIKGLKANSYWLDRMKSAINHPYKNLYINLRFNVFKYIFKYDNCFNLEEGHFNYGKIEIFAIEKTYTEYKREQNQQIYNSLPYEFEKTILYKPKYSQEDEWLSGTAKFIKNGNDSWLFSATLKENFGSICYVITGGVAKTVREKNNWYLKLSEDGEFKYQKVFLGKEKKDTEEKKEINNERIELNENELKKTIVEEVIKQIEKKVKFGRTFEDFESAIVQEYLDLKDDNNNNNNIFQPELDAFSKRFKRYKNKTDKFLKSDQAKKKYSYLKNELEKYIYRHIDFKYLFHLYKNDKKTVIDKIVEQLNNNSIVDEMEEVYYGFF